MHPSATRNATCALMVRGIEPLRFRQARSTGVTEDQDRPVTSRERALHTKERSADEDQHTLEPGRGHRHAEAVLPADDRRGRSRGQRAYTAHQLRHQGGEDRRGGHGTDRWPVSYTHLTLPTKR